MRRSATGIHPLFNIRKFIQRKRNCLNVRNAGRCFLELPTLKYIKTFILKRNLSNAINVVKFLAANHFLLNIRESILEKNPTLVRNVGKTSVEAQLLLNIREFIHEINSRNLDIRECAKSFS